MGLANKNEEQEQADKGFLIRLSVRERFLPYRNDMKRSGEDVQDYDRRRRRDDCPCPCSPS